MLIHLAAGSGHQPVRELHSPASSVVKHCVKLRTQNKYRQQTGSTLVVGVDALTELLRQATDTAPRSVLRLFAVQPTSIQSWGDVSMNTYLVSEPAMQKLTGLQSISGCSRDSYSTTL
ncbi:hypothetical protein WJX84_006730 [Apatococcus fuscideae]|uniref:Uncharacterized protein n=1 Tax=Apatococcus fuscideae TaxID=2026836 RepID=A0AAW1T258_9CHLO